MKTVFSMCKAVALLAALCPLAASAQVVINSSFTADKPILPSSQYTPGEPYSASVWVFNENRRYDEAYKNHVFATPLVDGDGHEWFAPDYEMTNGGGADWQTATAPFSSDEYYKDQRSFRWALVDIMAEIYIRRTFTLNSITAGDVYLTCGHDDAPSEWYINGTLVHTADDGWNNDEVYLLTDEQKALIKTDGSENVLAVHVHQNWGGAFADCGLYEANMTMRRTFLGTVADGAWPCVYYMLNNNDDIAIAEEAAWYALDEDEADWISGVGPFSNDDNMFYTTEWPSQEKPILIRRHFELSASDLASIISDMSVRLTCSYDENPKVWLNGTLIWSAEGWNDNNYADYVLSDEHKALFREGDNVLCVSLTQGGGGGHIDYGLIGEMPYNPVSGVASIVAPRPADNKVYNLFGQYLGESTENLPNGIYIVGGKKVVVCNR